MANEELTRLVFRTRAGKIIRGGPALDSQRLLAFLKFTAKWTINELDALSVDFNPVRLHQNHLLIIGRENNHRPGMVSGG